MVRAMRVSSLETNGYEELRKSRSITECNNLPLFEVKLVL